MMASQTARAAGRSSQPAPRALALMALFTGVDELTKLLARALLPLAEEINGRGPRLAGLIGLERVGKGTLTVHDTPSNLFTPIGAYCMNLPGGERPCT
jgi:hypothetical protein